MWIVNVHVAHAVHETCVRIQLISLIMVFLTQKSMAPPIISDQWDDQHPFYMIYKILIIIYLNFAHFFSHHLIPINSLKIPK